MIMSFELGKSYKIYHGNNELMFGKIEEIMEGMIDIRIIGNQDLSEDSRVVWSRSAKIDELVTLNIDDIDRIEEMIPPGNKVKGRKNCTYYKSDDEPSEDCDCYNCDDRIDCLNR